MPNLILELTNPDDLKMLLSLAHRLGVEVVQEPTFIDSVERRDRLLALEGSWLSDGRMKQVTN